MLGLRKAPDMGQKTYAYTKACGIISKSFIGDKTKNLERVSSLAELDRVIFPEAPHDLPEKELLLNLESRITERAVKSVISIVGSFSEPPEFLTLMVRIYEYADLKNAILAYLEKDNRAPAHTDLGRFQTVRFEAWPDMRAMLENTEFAFLLGKDGQLQDEDEDGFLESLLDRRYYTALWESLFALPQNERYVIEKILADEISLKNCCWALRLRTYYGMTNDEIKSHLIDIQVGDRNISGRKRSLAHEALASLELPLDNFSAWSSWRWKNLINPDGGGSHPEHGRSMPSFVPGYSRGHWHIDPQFFQNAASRYLYRLARHNFCFDQFSINTIFCFIKLKEFEEDILTRSAEGLNIGMSGRDILSLVGME